MSLKFGFGASAGHYLFNKTLQIGGIILTTGILRAAWVEAEQYAGNRPEDGNGFLMNTLVYSAQNVKDAAQFVYQLNEQTKN